MNDIDEEERSHVTRGPPLDSEDEEEESMVRRTKVWIGETKALLCQKAGLRIKVAWEDLCKLENNISGKGGEKRRKVKIANRRLLKMLEFDIREAWKYISELQWYLSADVSGNFPEKHRHKPLRKPRKRQSNRQTKGSHQKPLRKSKKLSRQGKGK